MKVFLVVIVIVLVALGLGLSIYMYSHMGDISLPGVGAGTPAPSAIAGWSAYTNTTYGFSIQYPPGYVLNDNYVYQNLGPSRDIHGVKLTIDPSAAAGTNLGTDSYISVESLPGAINSCSAEIYLDQPTSGGFVDEGGHRYSVATSVGAAAGNRYEETVYATPVANGCLAVRYFVHYGAIENYPPGLVKEFDRAALISQFDQTRRSLVLK